MQMKQVGSRLSYANVVATAALFFALSGGVVYAASTLDKNEVKSKNIAANAVTARAIAKKAVKAQKLANNAVTARSLAANAVTGAKIKKEAVTGGKVKKATLTRANLAAGTLAGLQIIELQSASVPGVTSEAAGGTPIPLTGTGSFTPATGKSYELLAELKGNPIDVDGSGAKRCEVFVTILDNGAPLGFLAISASANATPPFNVEPIGSTATAIGLLGAGQAQSLSALSFGSSDCSSSTTAALRAVVVELG